MTLPISYFRFYFPEYVLKTRLPPNCTTGFLDSLRAVQMDSLHNASLFCLRSGPKSCRCAAQTPADTGFLQAFDPTRGGSRAPLRLCDSRPLLGRQSCRFLETGSLFPPLAALRQFPPRTPPAKKNSFPSDRVFRQAGGLSGWTVLFLYAGVPLSHGCLGSGGSASAGPRCRSGRWRCPGPFC